MVFTVLTGLETIAAELRNVIQPGAIVKFPQRSRHADCLLWIKHLRSTTARLQLRSCIEKMMIR